ncbi:thiamine pyrophosphate-dependent enzyme [Peptostreptococcaceae bacterium AGR-M142]
MLDLKMYKSDAENMWCPGCGNFSILEALKMALAELDLDQGKYVLVSGIGQAAKTPHYIKSNTFHGLHGRALPAAFGVKAANKNLKVIALTGDGDGYGEGGNHLIHSLRRNINIAHFVHNNQIYGLTKGQGSPTTALNQKTTLQLDGVKVKPFNPISFAISQEIGFVARSFSGDISHLKEMMKAAILYDGYALLDILQPCVTFNKINTFKWYKDRVYKLGDDYDPYDINLAFKKSMEHLKSNKIPIGIIYKNKEAISYIKRHDVLNNNFSLTSINKDKNKYKKYLNDFR